jgi:exopolysaccharide production protein ExoZ
VLFSLQYLRGVAALMVVYFHVAGYVSLVSGHALPLTHIGSLGVDIFFVISGAIMGITTKNGMAPVSFMRKRLIRIVPLYWLITTFIAAGSYLLGVSKYGIDHLLASLLFIPWPNPHFAIYYPILVPGWTLNYEMMFYLIFAFVLFLPPYARLGTIAAVLAGLSIAGAMLPSSGLLSFYTNPIILEFGAGALVGAIYVSSARVPPSAASTTLIIGIGLLLGLEGCTCCCP